MKETKRKTLYCLCWQKSVFMLSVRLCKFILNFTGFYEVREGEIIPVDGLLLEGCSTTEEFLLTGESKFIEKNPGEQVSELLSIYGREWTNRRLKCIVTTDNFIFN